MSKLGADVAQSKTDYEHLKARGGDAVRVAVNSAQAPPALIDNRREAGLERGPVHPYLGEPAHPRRCAGSPSSDLGDVGGKITHPLQARGGHGAA
jgi:hypothetical protein